MKISKYPSEDAVNEAIQNDDPMLAVISFDGKSAIVSPLDDAVEHHILLAKAGKQSTDIDKYFRIIFDKSGQTGHLSVHRITRAFHSRHDG